MNNINIVDFEDDNRRVEYYQIKGSQFTTEHNGEYYIEVYCYSNKFQINSHRLQLSLSKGFNISEAYLKGIVYPIENIESMKIMCSYEWKPHYDTPLWKALNG